MGLRLRVSRIRQEAENIRSFELVPPDGTPLPPFEAGAHVEVTVPGGAVRCYSLCNTPGERDRYVIAVQREANGRGGSRAMHERVHKGDLLELTPPRNNFRLAEAPHTVLVAGGIGLTPLMAMAHTLVARKASFELHVCTRTVERTAFRQLLSSAPYARHVRFHHDGGDPKRGLDVRALLSKRADGAHVYCCGPTCLMDEVREVAMSAGWPSEALHFESFSNTPRPDDVGFEVYLRRSRKLLFVPPGKTILNVLREHGVAIETSCEEGVCGTCTTNVLSGEPDHRDQVLSDEERKGCMTVCVSRAKSKRIELDL